MVAETPWHCQNYVFPQTWSYEKPCGSPCSVSPQECSSAEASTYFQERSSTVSLLSFTGYTHRMAIFLKM